jgi:COP9 signalosome complex subunit 6
VKDVHKVPPLDLVGWYTILPASGPQPMHLPIHRQILDSYNESAIILGFHPEAVLQGSVGGKLPLTIYESNYEADDTTAESGEDKEMKDGEPQLGLKFKELPYTVETGEAEMISVDFVARGGGNATAVNTQVKPKAVEDVKGKGKTRSGKKAEEDEAGPKKDILSREDEELIASLTAKANAIKMLHARINLIAVYLQNLPPSYVSDSVPEGVEADSKKYTPVNHSVLRSIQALLSRLSLLIPADSVAFQQEMMSEQNDVNLVSLLGTITQSIKDAREMGKKFSVVEAGKHQKSSQNRGMDGSNFSMMSGVGDLLT